MTLLSKLRPLLKYAASNNIKAVERHMSDHRHFVLTPTRWQWNKFKDLIHFYVMLGIIPCGLFVSYLNLFTGPATLSEIPEGYVPKHYEYYKNPVVRFLARYAFTNPQQEYEKFLTHIFVEHETIRLRQLEEKIIQKMHERNDYQAYYYKPVAAKYYRAVREGSAVVEEIQDPLGKE